VLRGSVFSPELLSASDLKPGQIQALFKKFKESHLKKWPDFLYKDLKVKERFKPPLFKGLSNVKEEL